MPRLPRNLCTLAPLSPALTVTMRNVAFFAKLTIHTTPRLSGELLRTAADGCTRTVADTCEQLRDVERTDPQPETLQSETGLGTHEEAAALPRSQLHAFTPRAYPSSQPRRE